MRKITLSFFIGMALAMPLSAMADKALDTHMSAFAVRVDESGETVREPATSIEPGGVIEYALVYENISTNPLGQLVVLGDIPEQTQYVDGTQIIDMPSVFEARTSDIEWSIPPLIRYVENGSGVMESVEVPAYEYTGLRWKLAEPLSPGATISATYRVRVDQ